MDGRRLRRWWLSGCLVAGAVGCNRNAVRSPWDATPTGGQPVTGIPMAPQKKSLWGGSGGQAVVTPVEVLEPAKKGPPKSDTLIAFADARLAAAFDEKTPPANREALLDAARQLYQQALHQDPKNSATTLALARFYARVGERDKSVEMFKKYLEANPADRDVAHEVALAHARWKDWDGAVAWCDFALRLDPENLSFRKTKAFCLARGGKWEEGFGVMLQVMPEAQARYNMARVLEHQNQQDACRQQLVMALKADPNLAEAREFLAELDGTLAPGAAGTNALQQASYNQMP